MAGSPSLGLVDPTRQEYMSKYLLHYLLYNEKENFTRAAGNDDRLDCASLHTASQYVLDTTFNCLNKLWLTESIPFSRKRVIRYLGVPFGGYLRTYLGISGKAQIKTPTQPLTPSK